MRHKGERITTLGALMDAMTIEWGSRKTYAEIHYHSGSICRVDEHFDDGKGHSGAFTCDRADIDIAVFNEALTKGYITGKLEPGYVSKTEFVLTRNESLLTEIWAIARTWAEEDYYKKRSEYDVRSGKPGTYIKIVKVPDGEAPEEVRKAWVELVLPCHPVVGYAKWEERERGAVSGEQNPHNRYSYVVPQKEALQLLADKNQKAAQWWKGHGFPKGQEGMDHFSFYQVEVKEFAGTFTHQRVRVHDSMLGELDH